MPTRQKRDARTSSDAHANPSKKGRADVLGRACQPVKTPSGAPARVRDVRASLPLATPSDHDGLRRGCQPVKKGRADVPGRACQPVKTPSGAPARVRDVRASLPPAPADPSKKRLPSTRRQSVKITSPQPQDRWRPSHPRDRFPESGATLRLPRRGGSGASAPAQAG